jgi:phosphate butyryltransferase
MTMEQITTFEQMIAHLKSHSPRKRVAVVCGYDTHTFSAITQAMDDGLAEFILVGDISKYQKTFDLNHHSKYLTVVEAMDCEEAARKAVLLVREGDADILMKGVINTDVLLHAILNKEAGLLPHGRVLTHLAVMQIPSYDKLLFFSDAAVIPNPTLDQRLVMIDDAIRVCHQFGIAQPRIALVHCTEKVNLKFPVSLDYERIVECYNGKKVQDAIVDGPLDVRVACDRSSMEIKGISSPIDGQADVLIFPDIESGNAFYKAVTLFAHAEIAGLLMGPQNPVVLTSRSDSAQTKFYSLCMACIM